MRIKEKKQNRLSKFIQSNDSHTLRRYVLTATLYIILQISINKKIMSRRQGEESGKMCTRYPPSPFKSAPLVFGDFPLQNAVRTLRRCVIISLMCIYFAHSS